MQFQITSVQSRLNEKDYITIYMLLNGELVNSTFPLTAFEDAENCKATLMSAINIMTQRITQNEK